MLRRLSPLAIALLFSFLLGAQQKADARLLGHWKLNEALAPYADASGNSADMRHDPATATGLPVSGVEGKSVLLNWQIVPGLSTRLSVDGAAVQTDSFGFSFWVKPVNLATGGSLIAKEMAETNAGPDFSRLAWQVQVGTDDGSGTAALEFLVRGDDRSKGDYFGNVFSSVRLPLGVESDDWFHVAGGYDAATGRLVLTVNGQEAVSANGTPGARNSDGAPFVVGTVRNGYHGVFAAFSALACIDNVQIYDRTPTVPQAQKLIDEPDSSIPSEAGAVRFSAGLVAHWKLDEEYAAYTDATGNGNALEQDYGTTDAQSVDGLVGKAARIHWNADKGVSTRLYAFGAALQSDSFGFSFWMNPSLLKAGENLIGKEMPHTSHGPIYTRLAWQVQVGRASAAGTAPLEFLIRGDDRSKGEFFGNVLSAVQVPIEKATDEWFHIVGGYDAKTGRMTLSVNGHVAVSNNSRPGATSSGGGAIDVGSMRNGPDFAAYAATANIDDVQLYNGPLSAYEDAYLTSNEGAHIAEPFAITDFARRDNGDVVVTFRSHLDWSYAVDATVDLQDYRLAVNATGDEGTTTVTIPKATLDGIFGGGARPRLFVRVRPLLSDPDDSAADPPESPLDPFINNEKYIPQYHYSINAVGAAVGDPSGTLRYQGLYHMFTWDHAVSEDLVHWSARGWPWSGDLPPGSSIWTGSVVMDFNRTSGLGNGDQAPMVAVYTAHDINTRKEDVRLGVSDDYLKFRYYEGSPVLVTDDLTFRDPDVFWHEPTGRWVLVIVRSAYQQVQIYTSPDLKNWTWRSDFGPVGSRQEIWEVPGLAQVPIRGKQNKKKWVLFVSAGTNKVQYFVGEFDGSTFRMDKATEDYVKRGKGLDGTVFDDFESGSYADRGWTVDGDAFGAAPIDGNPDIPNRPVRGYLGNRLASSGVDGDWRRGTITSAPFTITKDCINFLISGGNQPGRTCVNLVVDGEIVHSATGRDSHFMRWIGWEVTQWKGRTARLQIVDDYDGFWGHVAVDHIHFSDTVLDTGREHTNWVDWGSDFYAPRMFRDYDRKGRSNTWIGWMGNWQYIRNIPTPTTWGTGVMSLPRRVQVVNTPRGYELAQKPLPAFRTLRGPVTKLRSQTLHGTKPITAFQPTANTYEIVAVYNIDSTNQRFGFNLCVGGGKKLVVGYDSGTSNVFIDRRESGEVSFSPDFPNFVVAPLSKDKGYVKFRIFIDQSSVEVFVNDGEIVMSSLIFPDPANRGIEMFSWDDPTTLRNLQAWQLNTIWR